MLISKMAASTNVEVNTKQRLTRNTISRSSPSVGVINDGDSSKTKKKGGKADRRQDFLTNNMEVDAETCDDGGRSDKKADPARPANATKSATNLATKPSTVKPKIRDTTQKPRRGEDSTELSDDGGDDTTPCAMCDVLLDYDSKALCCDFCGNWVCLPCSGMPGIVYDTITTNEIPNFIWTCDSCRAAIPTIRNMSKMLKDIKDEQTDSRQEMKKLHSRVEKIESTIDDKIQDAIEEYRERESRKCNIIIHNIPESDREQPEERRQEDMENLKDILDASVGTDHQVEFGTVTRLGKRFEGKNRLTKVVLDSVKSKRMILGAAKKLRESDAWNNIYVTPDLSPKEREKNKQLRAELKKRKEDGEDSLVIRKGKIVQLETRATKDHQPDRSFRPK